MSRSGYVDDYDGDDYSLYLYRGTVASAIRGKRGQQFFRDLVAALDAMPDKRLVRHDFETARGSVCALGSLAKARGVADGLKDMDPEDGSNAEVLASRLNIAECLAREVIYENDELGVTYTYGYRGGVKPVRGHSRTSAYHETDKERWKRMRAWAASKIRDAQP